MTERALVLLRRHFFVGAVLALAAGNQLEIWTQVADGRARIAVLAALAAGALLFRRRAPLVAPLVTAAAIAAAAISSGEATYDTSSFFFVLLLATWAFGSLPDLRHVVLGLAAMLAAGAIVMLRAPDAPWTEVLWISVPLLGLGVLAHASGRRAEQARRAEARAAATEQGAKRAVEEERARISRELHDVVAHSVSVMTVQASAVRRLLTPDQEREREALLVVEETGRQALAEMRRLLGIMREEGQTAERAPQPGIATIGTLVDHVREAGLPVELTVEGEPVRLPPGIDLSAYRIVQEALTNALRHAGPAHAWVAVRYGGDGVEIEVENDGRTEGENGGGHGLVGMRERVALCGGELRTGPRRGGGFRISARLPVAGGPA
ncbi:MAG TPA: sensor histidine kinase [Gaiellaceae bacterium]|nr:sensor histidine kinase [Gaiellaceae bacterium]